eukprot:73286_1
MGNKSSKINNREKKNINKLVNKESTTESKQETKEEEKLLSNNIRIDFNIFSNKTHKCKHKKPIIQNCWCLFRLINGFKYISSLQIENNKNNEKVQKKLIVFCND